MIDWKRWLPGLPDDEDEDPVSKALRQLQQGATDVGAGIGTGLLTAAQAASSYLPDFSPSPAPEPAPPAPAVTPVSGWEAQRPVAGSVAALDPVGTARNAYGAVTSALDAANEAVIASPLGNVHLQGLGREMAGFEQMGRETADDQQRLNALVAQFRAGDRSVEPEIQALQASINQRTGSGRPMREALLEAGARNPDKTAETLGGLVQGVAATALAPGLGSGVVRNVAAAALDPVGQATGAALELPGHAIGAARRGAGAVSEALGRNAERVAAADARMAAEGSVLAPAGLGALPEPGGAGRQTVEVLQDRLETATAAWQRARDAGDERMAALAREHAVAIESDLSDALNARRSLEPAITSDVGRRAETLPLAEETADTLSGAGSRRADIEGLGGPVSHIPSSINLNAGLGAVPEGGRRVWVPDARYQSGGFWRTPEARVPDDLRAAQREVILRNADHLGAVRAREELEASLARAPDDPELQRDLMSAIAAEERAKDVVDAAREWQQMVTTGDKTLATSGAVPTGGGAGALSSVNRALGEGIAGGVGGAVIEQGRNPDEDPRTAAARGFAVGAVGFPAATRLARGAARLAGAGQDVGGGARIALGDVPPSQIRRPQLPGFEAPRPGPVPEDLIPAGPGPRAAGAPGTAPSSAQSIGDALPEIIRQLNAPPAAAATEGASLPLVASAPGRVRRAANTAARLLSSGLNTVQTARIAGMLSDTAGQLANVAGGPVLQSIDITTGPIAAALDVGRVAATRAVGKQAAREVFFSETGERLKGMARGGSIGLGRAVDVLKGGLDAGEAAKLEQRGGFGTNIAGIAPAGSRAAGVADFAVEAPLRALGAADAVFKTSAQGGHLMAEAYAAARKANGGKSPSPEQMRAAAQLPEVLERVQYLSQRSVLQEDRMLTNWYKRAMNYRSDDPVEQATADLLKAGLAVEIPFVRTPYNVVAQGMGMTPAGLLGLIQDVKQGKSARETEQRLARVMLGTAIMAPVAAGVAEGRFTGPYPETEQERSLLPPGWRPWSAKVDAPNGETYYLPLSYAQGLAMPIVMGLLAREAYKKDGWSLEAAGKVAAGVGEYAAQETFLDGFGAIGKLFDSKASPATWQREAEQIAASYVPFSALGREMQRVMGMPARDPEGPWEAALATYPLTAGQVEPRQDVLGREASLGLGGPAGALVRAGVENDTGVLRAFRRAGEGLPMQAPDSIPDPDSGRARPLSEHQQHRWRRVFGRELRSGWSEAGAPSDSESLRAIEAEARQAANDTLMGRR